MPTSTITSKGQTSVPKEVREALDLGPGGVASSVVRPGRHRRVRMLEAKGCVVTGGAEKQSFAPLQALVTGRAPTL